jgi:hypothetical protein
MSFVIYNLHNFTLYRKTYSVKHYATEAAAKAALTRASRVTNKPNLIREDWKVISYKEFREIEPMVESTNLMSGNKFQIRASDFDTCVDAGTETYWSM